MDIPVEKKFKILCEIVRAQHFAWREAALSLAPNIDPVELGNKMWEITGVQTAKAYLKRIDKSKPLAPQIATSIAWSSLCMGEDATVEMGEGDEAFVKHADCPWYHWHKRHDLLWEDQPGCDTWFFTCDTWFFTAVKVINEALGTNVKIETQKSLPEGGDCCMRRIWVE
ncbi:MAG: hypothetical protein ACYTG7_22985 [Planctomycetota bacterium]